MQSVFQGCGNQLRGLEQQKFISLSFRGQKCKSTVSSRRVFSGTWKTELLFHAFLQILMITGDLQPLLFLTQTPHSMLLLTHRLFPCFLCVFTWASQESFSRFRAHSDPGCLHFNQVNVQQPFIQKQCFKVSCGHEFQEYTSQCNIDGQQIDGRLKIIGRYIERYKWVDRVKDR